MMTLEQWAAQLVHDNVPFVPHGRARTGIDCYGVLWLAHKEVYNNLLPSYTDQYTPEDVNGTKELNDAFASGIAAGWTEVKAGKEQEGDGVMLMARGGATHVGLVYKRGMMVHIEKGINVCSESYTSVGWRDRIVGFYRHNSRA